MAYIVMAYIGTVQKGMAFGMLREALGGVEGGGVVDAVQCDGQTVDREGTEVAWIDGITVVPRSTDRALTSYERLGACRRGMGMAAADDMVHQRRRRHV